MFLATHHILLQAKTFQKSIKNPPMAYKALNIMTPAYFFKYILYMVSLPTHP